MSNLLAVLGFALQYLRAQPGFTDIHAVFVVVLSAIIYSLGAQQEGWKLLFASHDVWQVLSNLGSLANLIGELVEKILAGLAVAMAASHHTDWVPKYQGKDDVPPTEGGSQ